MVAAEDAVAGVADLEAEAAATCLRRTDETRPMGHKEETSMTVRELMTVDPEACTPQDTLNLAGQIMRRRRCGFVPVVDSRATKQVIGVLTDRDVAP